MTIDGALLAPQRPRVLQERFEAEGYILEPDWVGRRALIRFGLGEPRYVGYQGPFEGPRGLYEAIADEIRATSAVIDGVIVEDWKEEAELDVDASGNVIQRTGAARPVFMAFDLLEVDGESLLDVPLLERKRHLEGVVTSGAHIRLTPYVSRNLASWGDTLKDQGFRRAVLKEMNSPYSPGQTTGSWLVAERFGTK